MNDDVDVDGALLALRAGIIARLANRRGGRVSPTTIRGLLSGRSDAEALAEALARFRNRSFVRRFLDLVDRTRLR